MQDNRQIAVAVGLMRAALALLDRERETHGAVRLREAIDATLTARPLRPGEELPADLACLVAGVPLDPPAASDTDA